MQNSFEEVNVLLEESDEHLGDGRFAEAQARLREALTLAIELDGEQTPDIALIKNKLASALYQSGDYATAEQEATEALAIIKEIFDDVEGEEKHLILLRSRMLLGTLHREQGRYEKAEYELKRALDYSIDIFGEEHEQTSDAMNNLAIVYKYTAKFDEAEKLYKQALSISQERINRLLLGSATIYHNLGGLAHARGQAIENKDEAAAKKHYAEGEPLARRSYELRREILGEEQPETMADLAALAGLLDGLGRFEESEKIYRKTIAFFEKFYGPVHYEVAVSLNNLAGVLDATERKQEAEAAYRRAYEIKEKLFGAEHIEIAIAANNLGVLLSEQGETSEARKYLEKALQIFQGTLAPEHPNIKTCQGHLQALGSVVSSQ